MAIDNFLQNPKVLCQWLDGETVLLNLESERYYGLDRVGTRLWQLLRETDSVEATVQKMLTEFDVAETVLRGDVARWLSELLAAGLLLPPPASLAADRA